MRKALAELVSERDCHVRITDTHMLSLAPVKDATGDSKYCVGMHLELAAGEISHGAEELARAAALQEAIVHQEAILSALPRLF